MVVMNGDLNLVVTLVERLSTRVSKTCDHIPAAHLGLMSIAAATSNRVYFS